MSNRPYFSEGVNLFNEVQYTTTPATYGSNVVNVTQAQGRKIYDTDNTAIYGREPTPIIPGSQYGCFQPKSILKTRSTSPYSGTASPNYIYPNNPFHGAPPNIQSPYYYAPNQMMVPEKQIIPGGVTYTFNPAAQQYALRNVSDTGQNMWSCGNCGNCVDISPHPIPVYQPLSNIQQQYYNQPQSSSLQQEIAMKNFQQHNLEMLLMEEYMKNNPFQLKFHQDGQTDTVDLLGGNYQAIYSKGTPDFSNIPGAMAQTYDSDLKALEHLDKSCGYCGHISRYKQLNLQKTPDLHRKPEDMRVDYSNTHDTQKVGPDTCVRNVVLEDKNVGPDFANQNLQTCECPKYIGKQTGPDYRDQMNYAQNINVMENSETQSRINKEGNNPPVSLVSPQRSKHYSEKYNSTEDEITCTNSTCTFLRDNRNLCLIGTPCPRSITTVDARNQNLFLLGKNDESRSIENVLAGGNESKGNKLDESLFLLGNTSSEETQLNESIYAPGKDDLSVIEMVLADEKEKKRLEEESYKEQHTTNFVPSTSKETKLKQSTTAPYDLNEAIPLKRTSYPGSITSIDARNQNLFILGKNVESRSNSIENVLAGESESEINEFDESLFLLGNTSSEKQLNESIYAPGRDDLSVIEMVLADEKEKKRLEEQSYKEQHTTSNENKVHFDTTQSDLNVPKTLKKYGRKMKRYLKTKVKDHMDRIAEEYSDVGYSSSDSNNSEHSR